jgi:hypothetical protein
LGGPIKAGESYWMLDDGEININLQKMNKAEVWDRPLLGKGGEAVDEFTREEQKKKIMLERFQDEVLPSGCHKLSAVNTTYFLFILCPHSIQGSIFPVQNLMARSQTRASSWVGCAIDN